MDRITFADKPLPFHSDKVVQKQFFLTPFLPK